MSKIFIIEVEEVRGYCSHGYQVGDTFSVKGLLTPDTPICGGAYMVLFPMMNALHSGAQFDFEKNPYSKTKLACPDNGYVVFKISLIKEK